MSRRVYHHRARAINEIPGGNLVDAFLKAILEAPIGRVVRNSTVNRENRSDAGIDVDVRRSVQRVKHQDILSLLGTGNWNDVGRFFRRHHAEMAVMAHGAANRLLRKLVELLNGFTM